MKKDVLEDIDTAPSIEPWVSVKDRSPEKDGRYLVAMADGYVGAYLWVDGLWWSGALNVCDDGSVTHWMPLPELPKEDDDETN